MGPVHGTSVGSVVDGRPAEPPCVGEEEGAGVGKPGVGVRGCEESGLGDADKRVGGGGGAGESHGGAVGDDRPGGDDPNAEAEDENGEQQTGFHSAAA